jgi:hypothetical protein
MKKQLFLIMLLLALVQISISAQDETTQNKTENVQNFTLGADFVSQYVWRGLPYSTSPNIQPSLSYTNNKGNFTIGAWSSYSLSDYYGEVDWFASLDLGPITISAWDYFTMTQQDKNYYFDYVKGTTNHALEGSITYTGPESFPIGLSWSTFFYGNDQNVDSNYYYSSYFEASYLFKWKANNIKVFAGITPWEGLYADEFAMNNLGITNTRNININDKLSIPISGSIIINPYKENIFFVLSIGLYAND